MPTSRASLSIGSGSAYANDRLEPAAAMADSGRVSYIGFDCLAERTMALAHEFPVAAQVLVYPMLDDRFLTPSSRSAVHPRLWNTRSNALAWAAYLEGLEPENVPAYAAPARATDLSGVARTWVGTGELDLFRDEDIDFATRLMAAGVSTELHVYRGAVHGFDLFAPDAEVSWRFVAER